MSNSRKVAYNTVVQVAGRVAGLFISLVTINYVANHLQVGGSALVGYGQYTIVFTYVTILAAVADLGLFTLMVREMANKDERETGRLIGTALVFRVALMLIFLAIFAALYPYLPYDQVVRQGILIGVVITFFMLFSQAIETVFQARLVSDRTVVVETAGKIAIAVLTIWVLKEGHALLAVVLINLIGQVVTLGLAYLLARPLIRISWRLDRELWQTMSGQFWSIALVNVLALVHFKSDTLLLTFFKPAADVGIYGIAYKILEVILVIPSIVAANLLPVLTGLSTERATDQFGAIVRRSITLLFASAAFIAVYVILFSSQIISFISQRAFLAATVPLRILAFSLLFVFMTTLLSQAIIASRNQQQMVKGYLLVILVNVGLNLYAIPRFSYVGAASTTVITEGILMVYTFSVIRRSVERALHWPSVIRIAAAAVLTGVTSWLLAPHLISYDTIGAVTSRSGLTLDLTRGLGLTLIAFTCFCWLLFGRSLKELKGIFSLRNETSA